MSILLWRQRRAGQLRAVEAVLSLTGKCYYSIEEDKFRNKKGFSRKIIEVKVD